MASINRKLIFTSLFVLSLASFALHTAKAASVFRDENWVGMGGVPSVGGLVYAFATCGSNVYAAGEFKTIGGIAAENIAEWNGSEWKPLGGGLGGIPFSCVYALAASGNNLYVGGRFTTATNMLGQSVLVNAIAKWDGSNWSRLGGGLADTFFGGDQLRVKALAVIGTNLYVAGQFSCATNADGTWVETSNIAKWDGARWSALGQGTGEVLQLLAVGDELYASGFLTAAGGIPATRIAKWDGTAWAPLGLGIGTDDPDDPSWVGHMAMVGGDLYVGGNFGIAGGQPASLLARWDGSNWHSIPPAPDGRECIYVSGMASTGTNLFVAGEFVTPEGDLVTQAAEWDGINWLPRGDEHFNYESALAICDGTLYAALRLPLIDQDPVRHIAKWDGTNWSGLGSGLEGEIATLSVSGEGVYAGGSFTMAGGKWVDRIAKWNGTSWSAVGSGVNGYVFATATSGKDLYAGGSFTLAGGAGANLVAKWDGTSWSALGTGLQGLPPYSTEEYPAVYALVVSGSNVIAAGDFASAGGIPASHIACWNGSIWAPLGSGMEGTVRALAVSGTNLYAAGFFTMAGGVQANGIARWDGTTWSPLGLGFNDAVKSLVISSGNLYAAGSFRMGDGVNSIARWDGADWFPLGGGLNMSASALAVSGSEVYAAGEFTFAGGLAANCIARWDGTNWSAMGSGITGHPFEDRVNSLAVCGRELYVGGAFMKAGGKPAAFIAKAFLDGLPLEFKKGSRITPERFFEAVVSGPSGARICLDGSEDLEHWQPFATNDLPSGGLPISLPVGEQERQFYRARLAP